MKKWLDSNDEIIGKASIKKRRKELEEFARIGKIEDQMDSDLLGHHYHIYEQVHVYRVFYLPQNKCVVSAKIFWPNKTYYFGFMFKKKLTKWCFNIK